MSDKVLFEGQAVKSELVVMTLEKWDLHPQFEEVHAAPNTPRIAEWPLGPVERRSV